MRNLTMLTDLYQLTMMYGYLKSGRAETRAVFDMFYRSTSGENQFAVMAGLEQLTDYIENLRFEEGDLDYLKGLKLFDDEFIDRLRGFEFKGDIYSVPEGSVVFPGEPIIRVEASIFEAQLIETALLNIINHQTLIATKAARVRQAAGPDDSLLEFGLRRAQGPDAGIYGARAAVIGGFDATSDVLAGQMFGIPVRGTHAHSWVMSFPDELTAFREYARRFPNSCMLLIDTFDTLKSGLKNAITVFTELREAGYNEGLGVRLDSGDLAYLSREVRRRLNDAGFESAKICASGDLDEHLIRDLKLQGASIDIWGVGTKLITGGDTPALGGVYKLSAEIQEGGAVVPKIKISENPAKVTNPGKKSLYRLYGADGMAIADLIALAHERFDAARPLTIFDPVDTWKTMTLTDYTMRDMHVPIFVGGRRVYDLPPLAEIRAYCARELSTLWEQYRRPNNPHIYKVDLSDELWMLKQAMLRPAHG